MPVVRQRVAGDDVDHVLALDEHVGLANRVALVVQLLPEHGQPGLRVEAAEMLFRDRQHPAGASRGIIDRAHDAGV